MGKEKETDKEEMAEDWCFHCKDGGHLRVCDYKDCPKAYHPRCVEKEDSFLESEDPWTCRWHFCFICKSTPKFYCICCPKAICGRCHCDAGFAVVRRRKGFCNHCLTLLGFIERVKNPDSDEVIIDFNDRDTYEFMFKYYWEIIKAKEGLTSEHVHRAVKQLNMDGNFEFLSGSSDASEEENNVSDFEDKNQLISNKGGLSDKKGRKEMRKWKRKKGNSCAINRKVKSKKEFNGWGSKLLINFLDSIGKDTACKLSTQDVAAIIIQYCNKHKLFDPVKKKKVVCDARLKSLLGRKSFHKNSIHKLLTTHFAENLEQSEDEFEYCSEDKDDNALMTDKRQQSSKSYGKSQNNEAEATLDMQEGGFASVITENIKHVYLKRCLVEELSKQPETFAAKVIGSFVRIKSDPYDCFQRNYCQLVKVTGIKNLSKNDGMTSDVLLQVSNMPKDIPICQLLNDNFSEEECEDLQKRVRDGRLERPSLVEFKEKAQSLHEVITKYWIERELVLVQNQINQANEKGWRKQYFESLERMKLLQTPAEQSRLLHQVPEIIADKAEVELADKDFSRKDEQENNNSPELDIRVLSKPSKKSSEGCGISACLNDGTDSAEHGQLMQQNHTVSRESGNDGFHQSESNESAPEVMQNHSKESHPQVLSGHFLTSLPQAQANCLLPEKQQPECNAICEEKQGRPVDTEPEKPENKQNGTTLELIGISDDEKQDKSTAMNKQMQDDLNSCIWYYVSPHGLKGGPYSMSMLKEWKNNFCYEMKFKVWKTGQQPEDAIFLKDAIRQFCSGK